MFGGSTLTSTDVAAAGGLCRIGDPSLVKADKELVQATLDKIHEMVETVIDEMKVDIFRKCMKLHLKISGYIFFQKNKV